MKGYIINFEREKLSLYGTSMTNTGIGLNTFIIRLNSRLNTKKQNNNNNNNKIRPFFLTIW